MPSAFSAGVEPGGLRSAEEIKLLICYLLNSLNEPVPRKQLLEIIYGNGMANFFDTGAAADDLIQKGHVHESSDGTLRIADSGKEIAETLARTLPFTLRERSVQIALQLLSRIRANKDSVVTVEQTKKGYKITCRLREGDEDLLTVSVNTPDSLQATAIKENFLNDPALLYRSTLAVLNQQIEQDENTLRILL
ncbi:MAG: DUF4364 family protein [Clostridia bacterium]|nr:DUF4364 family protein [Clostridia bacterium]